MDVLNGFVCVECGKSYTTKGHLVRHSKVHNADRIRHSCEICGKTYANKDSLRKHEKNAHALLRAQQQIVVQPVHVLDPEVLPEVPEVPEGNTNTNTPADFDWLDDGNDDFLNDLADGVESAIFCENSGKRLNRDTTVAGRQKKARLEQVGNAENFIQLGKSFNSIITWYYKKNTLNIINYTIFLQSIKTEIIEILQSATLPIKFNIKLEATYNIPNVNESSENRSFKSGARPIFEDSNIEEILEETFTNILNEQDAYQGKGSGFTLEHIDGILLAVYKYTPMSASSYIETPKNILSKRACVNPQNTDRECFKWAILAKHVTGENKYRVDENYKMHEERYNFSDLTFPTPLHEIKLFEKNNSDTSVNVYGVKKNEKTKQDVIFPLKVVNDEKIDHFDLLLITKEENTHYIFISDFSRLISSQKTSHNAKSYFCKSCFTSFNDRRLKYKLYGKEALDNHKKICGPHKPILPKMPTEGETIEFEAWSKTQRHPVVIYADFEAILMKISEKRGQNTTAYQSHKPMSYGLIVKTEDEISLDLLKKFEIPTSPIIYRGSETRQEVAKHFIQTVVDIAQKIEKLFKINKTIYFEDGEMKKHIACTACNLCKNEFSNSNIKTADHNHLTGAFRQSICNTCNLKLRRPNFIPCYIHNLTNYDAHFIVKELGYDVENISVIASSEEKLISFSKYIGERFSIRFIDTCRFMASKLSTLAFNLITPDFEKFRVTAKHFSMEHIRLVTRKGVYPYEYTDRWEVLEETELPSKENFYSSLTEENITEQDYAHAKEVWEQFDCKTLGEYSDLYLKIDILLLADVFENFRDVCMLTYNLDPAFYFTAPGLSFDAMLKCTEIKLELLSDYDMLLMIEKGIRGGLTQASMRHAKANNITIPGYDTTKEDSWLIYQDCNNLYGWAMAEYMPYGGFKWVEASIRGLEDLDETSPIGRIYEVDIIYPRELHNLHEDLPFLPENKIPPGSKILKLIATLERKSKYIIHYRNLKQAMANGLVVEKVHRVVQFNQSAWLSKYINLNTEMRKKAKNEFEKDYWKLMNNSLFGKTMESMRKRLDIRLVANEKKVQKLINKPTFKYCTSYSENLVAVTMERKIIDFCKPIYIGFAVLDISKTLMYDYHYSVIKSHYKNKAILMYTDTDSLIYHIYTKDFYNDIRTNPILLDRLDTSGLPTTHPCHTLEKKKVPGFFSDELNGKTMTEFVALRAKSYAYSVDGVEQIKAKGIRRHVVKNHMTLADHVRSLHSEPGFVSSRDNVSFRSFKHNIVTIRTSKLAFSNNDDKRVILDDGIHTLPYGHYRINEPLYD